MGLPSGTQPAVSSFGWWRVGLTVGGWLGWLLLTGCDGTSRGKTVTASPSTTSARMTETSPPPPWFADVTAKSGLKFQHRSNSTRPYFMPRSVGSGACFFDFNNDGRLDCYLLNNAGPDSGVTNQLFRQDADGHFYDISAGSGLDVAGWGMGVAAADADNDGLVDLMVTEYGNIRLFRNLGEARFREVTAESGLHRVLWGTSACWLDYDRDGWLDLAIANYLEYDPARPCADPAGVRDFCGPIGFPGSVCKLYHNLGKLGEASLQFEDVTGTSGIGAASGPGLGIVSEDFNDDGWPDLLVSNDGRANHLWLNQRDGRFREDGFMQGVAVNGLGQALANMGIAVGDLRGTGQLTIFMTHLGEENHGLWTRSRDGLLFEDTTALMGLSGLAWQGTGFGSVLADFDLDGDLDLAIANGRVRRDGSPHPRASATSSPTDFWAAYRERNQVLELMESGGFVDRSSVESAFCGEPGVHRSLVLADFDNDGAPDLLATQIDGPARLFRNVAPRNGHWITMRAVDPRWRRDAYGAVIEVHAGRRHWQRTVSPAFSYLASNDPRVHFGLGGVGPIDEVRVRWPDGLKERFLGLAVDQIHTLVRGEGRPLSSL